MNHCVSNRISTKSALIIILLFKIASWLNAIYLLFKDLKDF